MSSPDGDHDAVDETRLLLSFVRDRFAFLAQRLTVQWTWAALAWAVHLAAFAVLVALIYLP